MQFVNPIDQMIYDWEIANPTLFGFILGIVVALSAVGFIYVWYVERRNADIEARARRTRTRAEIKRNGGL